MKLFPQPDTLIEDAERIKQSSEEKEDYSDLYTKICDKDLIAAYNKCRIKLIRWETTTKARNINRWFQKAKNHIDRYVIDMNQTIYMKIALSILYWEPSSGMPSTTLQKCKSRFRNYYHEEIFVLSTQKYSEKV